MRLALPAHAQPALDTELVVSAARTDLPITALPLTARVLGRSELERQVAVSGLVVDALAALIPSFSPSRQKLTGQGETLRGRSPLFAIDGVPQTSPLRDGGRDGFTIDPFFIDRIEVIQGSNALQGIGATGGVINQVTVSAPAEDGWSARTLLQATAENDFKGDGFGGKAAALVSRRSGSFDATFGVAYESRGTYRDGAGRRIGIEGTQGEIQETESLSFFLKAGVVLTDDVRLEVMAQSFDIEGNNNLVVVSGNRATGLPTTALAGISPGDAPRNQAKLVSLALTADDLAGGTLRARAFWNRTNDTYGGGVFGTFQDPALPPFGQFFDQSANKSRKYGGNLTYERVAPGLEQLRLLAGLDVLYDRSVQTLAQSGRAWVPPTDYRSIAPFAQANLALFDDRLRLSAGVRHENVRITVPDYTTLFFYGAQQVTGGSPRFAETLPNAGIVLEPIPGIRAYASYSEGYTVPDVGRITRAISQPGVEIERFLDLAPIIANNREIGLEIKQGPLEATATYFWSNSDRGQLLVLNVDVFEVERQRIELQGLELNIRAQTPWEGLTLSTGYAHLEGRVDNDGDGRAESDLDGANIGPDRLNLAANFTRGRLGARVQWSHYFQRRFAGGDPRNDFEGFNVVDAFIQYRTSIGDFNLSAQNLTNRQYITYNSDTVRPTDNLRFFAGRGRSVTLGWFGGF